VTVETEFVGRFPQLRVVVGAVNIMAGGACYAVTVHHALDEVVALHPVFVRSAIGEVKEISDGLKGTEGTIQDFDRGGKKLVVATGVGSESIFRLTDHAAKDSGKGIADGTKKGTQVTVYYSEDAGGKVAHFFE
jgi:hypothetical protein